MTGVLAVLAAIVALGLTLRIGTVALTLTGLSRDVARFQVRSAFFGAGFTTSESEAVMNHPVRRRIVQMLIVWGAIGLTGIVGSSVLTLTRQDDGVLLPIVTLLGGFVVLYVVFSIRPVDRLLQRIIERVLRRYTDLDTQDYRSLLRLSGDYTIRQFDIRQGGRLAGHSIAELLPHTRNVVLLGIERPDGTYIGVPPADTVLTPGDRLTVYGHDATFAALDDQVPVPERST